MIHKGCFVYKHLIIEVMDGVQQSRVIARARDKQPVGSK